MLGRNERTRCAGANVVAKDRATDHAARRRSRENRGGNEVLVDHVLRVEHELS